MLRAVIVHGLLRVKHITQDDAHLFCTAEQIEDEIFGCLDFASYLYDLFGLTAQFELDGCEQTELLEHRWMKHLVAGPNHAADAVVEAYTKKRDELYVPKAWRIANVMRTLTPGLMARFVSNPAATPGAGASSPRDRGRRSTPG